MTDGFLGSLVAAGSHWSLRRSNTEAKLKPPGAEAPRLQTLIVSSIPAYQHSTSKSLFRAFFSFLSVVY